MTDTISIAPDAQQSSDRGRTNGNLSAMLLPELKKVAHDLGLSGISSMKKSDLVAAISAAQSGSAPPARAGRTRRPRVEVAVAAEGLTSESRPGGGVEELPRRNGEGRGAEAG